MAVGNIKQVICLRQGTFWRAASKGNYDTIKDTVLKTKLIVNNKVNRETHHFIHSITVTCDWLNTEMGTIIDNY